MNIIHRMDRRLTAIVVVVAMVLVAGLLIVFSSDGRASNDPILPDPVPSNSPVTSSSPEPSGTPTPSHEVPAQDLTASQVTFHDDMRQLWEDHAQWTRLVIVTTAEDAPGYPASANRLLENQQDIGNAIKPYYGEEAGNQLAVLLTEHINIAVEILDAAKNDQLVALDAATADWYANSDEIADYLAAANPDNWSQEELRAMMEDHLDQTLVEALAEFRGDYEASVNAYEVVHNHILVMADTLSSGIIAQFPDKFEG